MGLGHQPLLVQLPPPEPDQWHLVVLHGQHGILLVPGNVTIFWRQAQGLLANVCSPHCHSHADGIQLDVQPLQNRLTRHHGPRLRRHLFGCNNIFYFTRSSRKFLYSFVNFSLPRLLSMLNTKEHATLCLPFSPACGSSPAWLFTHSGLSRRKLLGVTLLILGLWCWFHIILEHPLKHQQLLRCSLLTTFSTSSCYFCLCFMLAGHILSSGLYTTP